MVDPAAIGITFMVPVKLVVLQPISIVFNDGSMLLCHHVDKTTPQPIFTFLPTSHSHRLGGNLTSSPIWAFLTSTNADSCLIAYDTARPNIGKGPQ